MINANELPIANGIPMNKDQEILQWLLQGDVSIQYQTKRDLLNIDDKTLQHRIAEEGWGQQFLSKRKPEGHWGKRFYEPKWISSHYTILDLKNLGIASSNALIQDSIRQILEHEKANDGGIGPIGSIQASDVCVNGMFLNYASYFKAPEKSLRSVVDFLLREWMDDGGFNCRSNRSGAHHSSMHSTISVLEGITSYHLNGYTYRIKELLEAKQASVSFLLCHHLFLSDRTGEIIHKDFLKLSYPSRWKYDILRALDCFQAADVAWEESMQEAIDVLMKKQNKNGTWNVQAKYPGKVHFDMEKAGKPSRWNTLRALRVLKHFKQATFPTTAD